MRAAAVLERAEALLASGRPGAVRPLLAALRRLQADAGGADRAPVDALEARLLLREGRHASARAVLDAAVSRHPADLALRRTRTELLLAQGERVAAAREAAELVALAPHDPAARALLGVAMGKVGQWPDAIACLSEAVAGDAGCVAHRLALARVQQQAGDGAAARATVAAAVAASPGHAGARSALMALLVGDGDFDGAVALAEATRETAASDALLLGLHGLALCRLGRDAAAGEAYQDALAMAPDNPLVRHLAASGGCVASAARAPEAYVRMVFDSGAHRYVEDAIGQGCRVPGLVRAAVRRHLARSDAGGAVLRGPVLDLGCGTGLLAMALSDLQVGPWHGVDLSPAMLAQAAASGLYRRLDEADLMAALAEPGPAYGLILAADVLCHFGDLEPVLAAAAARLAGDGVMVLSLEQTRLSLAGAGWRLGRDGRYAHTPAGLAAAAGAAGLMLRAVDHETLRMAGDTPIPGLLAVLAPCSA